MTAGEKTEPKKYLPQRHKGTKAQKFIYSFFFVPWCFSGNEFIRLK